VLVGKHLFRYRFDYREEWLRFTHTLSERSSAPEVVGQQMIRGLADMLESPSGALWTRARSGSGFSQSARWNQTPLLLHEDEQSPLCRLLGERGWVINLNEVRAQPRAYAGLELPPWLQGSTRAWLVIPLLVEQALIGFCVLDQARTRMDLDWEVNDLLKTAGQQAASYLAQAQSAEALLEARKFEAFNRMSAFVAHDLKNIVTQLALMLGNAKRLGHNPAFQEDMLMTIEHALDRMRHVLLQLGQPAALHAPVAPGGVELLALMQRIAEQCRRTCGQQVEIDASGPLQVRGQSERLERVLGHMVHNALDATAGGGRTWVQVARSGNQAHICIGDTGCGMSASFIQNRLFKPFQSTKPAGMGIGAFESLQYVQELGGSIVVDSAEGQGTRMTLQLPLFESPLEVGPCAVRYTP
jgi:putative PEP-CTERM system histidine kinase